VELWAQGEVIAFECNGTGVYLLEPGATSPKLLVGGDSVCKAFGAQARASLDITHGGLLYATGPSDAGIWRLDVRTGRRERLTPPGLEWTVGEPVASSDGRRVAFVWDKGEASGGRDQLYLMSADGSAPKSIGPALHGDEFGEISWAPDGRLSFSYRPEGAEGGVVNVMVAVADTVGSTAKPVAGGMSPAWSADGRWLAFVKPVVPSRGYARTAAVAIIRANGTGERVLFASADTGAFTNGFEWIRNGTPEGRIVWDPQGIFVVFSRLDSGGMSLWRVNVDGTELRQLTTRARPQSNY
jgi:Tol biopolymer transport system component